jgi:hypothetical protein
MLRSTLISAITAACFLASAPAALTAAQTAQAAKLLASDNPADLAAASKGFRSQGAEVRLAYRGMLEKAEVFHKERLKTRIAGSLTVLRNFAEAQQKWAAAKEACLELLYQKTDHEARKLADLARSYTTAEKAMKDLSRPLKNPPAGLTSWEASAAALNVINADLAWCRDTPESDQEYFRAVPAKDHARALPAGTEFLELAGPYQERLDAQAAMEQVGLFNSKEIRWPAPPLKTFMELINARRYVLGLTPLRLDERLSNCARDHSKEMRDLKFFAHESPTEKNKTPWDRAKNAEFEGQCMGENIFMGSAAPEAAFNGWWESDGHRFIMFQKDANTLGLGVVGVHWTLNTGTRDWTEAAVNQEKSNRPG